MAVSFNFVTERIAVGGGISSKADVDQIVAAGLTQGAAFRLPLAARILTGTPGLRWVLPSIIGWGVRPARVKAGRGGGDNAASNS